MLRPAMAFSDLHDRGPKRPSKLLMQLTLAIYRWLEYAIYNSPVPVSKLTKVGHSGRIHPQLSIAAPESLVSLNTGGVDKFQLLHQK